MNGAGQLGQVFGVVDSTGEAVGIGVYRLVVVPAGDIGPTLPTYDRPMADMGALRYMAPELGRDPIGDARADVYSLGVIAYEMLTGRVPLGGVRLPSQLNEDVPAEVDPVIMRCIAKAPADRYRDMRALVHAIDELGSATPSLSTSRLGGDPAGGGMGRMAAILGGGAAIVAIIALLATRACG